MTTAHPIRCPMPHPSDPGRVCNAVLTRAVPGTVEVKQGSEPPPGCNEVLCARCGTRYVVCARAA